MNNYYICMSKTNKNIYIVLQKLDQITPSGDTHIIIASTSNYREVGETTHPIMFSFSTKWNLIRCEHDSIEAFVSDYSELFL